MRHHDLASMTLLTVIATAAAAGGCESSAGTVCDLMCECEHCNDYEEESRCAQLEWQADVAEAYDCTSKFESWASCVEENGSCDENEASFSTLERGSCSGKGETGLDCSLDPGVCAGIGSGSSCENGTCKYRACAGALGPNPPACGSDADCGFGPDRCAEARTALVECEQEASEVNPFLEPPPGGSSGDEG